MTLSSISNVCTVLGTGIVVWGIATKFLANVRRRWYREWLTPLESQIVALALGVVFMGLAVILLLSLSSHALVQQHTALLDEFNRAVAEVLAIGLYLVNQIRALAHLPPLHHLPPVKPVM